MKTCKIYIGGNIYRAGNIGDDAVVQGILCLLESVAPEADITIGTHCGQKLDYLPPEPTFIDSFNMAQVTAAIKASDWFICGGGTLIGDELGLSFPLEYNARLISIARFYGKRVSMLGIGANKLHHPKGARIARTIVKLCDLITLRDEESREVCLAAGARPSRTVTIADPAFLLEPKQTARTKELKERLRSRGKILGVNVVNEAWSRQNKYKANIAHVCEQLSSEHGYFPVFFCNEIRPGDFFDFEANKQTAAMLNCEREVLEPVYYSPEEMIDLISGFDFVLGMRMHALIFAAIAGTPFAAISRVDKVDNFMRLFGLEASGSVDRCSSDQLIAEIEQRLDQRDVFQAHLAERVAQLRQECLKNVDLFRGLISERRMSWRKVTWPSFRLLLSENTFYRRVCRLLRGDVSFSDVMQKAKARFDRKRA